MDTEAVARRWIELYNDVEPGTYGSDRFLELYDDNCIWREMPSRTFPEGRRSEHGVDPAALSWAKRFLRDRHVDLQDLIVDGDSAALRYEWSATVQASGVRVRQAVAAFFRVRAGKLVEVTEIVSEDLGPSDQEADSGSS